MFPPKGEMLNNLNILQDGIDKPVLGVKELFQMDQDYIVVGNHIKQSLQEKIVAGSYVDFSKLLPKDRILAEEDGQMDLVVRNGKAFWTPISEGVTINNFNSWEQAFRVYSNIYTRAYPNKAGQLIEYNHVIHSISQSFTWENVYGYDRDFRLHMAWHHPDRSWVIILQQAWSMRLRDHLTHGENNAVNSTGHFNNSYHTPKNSKSNNYCRRFNKGKCNLGRECAYEHRCSYCGKFGHGVIVCRKLIFDKEKAVKPHHKKDNGAPSHSMSHKQH